MRRQTVAAAVAVAGLLAGQGAWAEPAELKTAEAVQQLCEGLRPPERLQFSPDKPQGRGEYERARQQLLKAEYQVELPWGAFTVAEWDPEQKVVLLSTERPFRTLDGALTLFDADRDEIELEALEGEGEALKAGLAQGTLTLQLVFRPAEEEGSPCVIGKAKTYALAADFVSAQLRLKGKPLAEAVKEGFESKSLAAGGKPTVEVAPAAHECPTCSAEMAGGVEKVKPLLERCYLEALSRSPALDGSVVLALEASGDGKLAAKSVVADSLQDAPTVACIKAAVGTAKAPGKNGRGMVMVRLERK